MQSISSDSLSIKQSNIPNIILSAGLLAGIMDIVAACIHHSIRGGTPLSVLKFVASGLLGLAAFKPGIEGYLIGLLGLTLHFFIATSWAAIFFVASRKLKFLINHAVICGILYGLVVFWFMRLVVMPLSAVVRQGGAVKWTQIIIGMSIHIVCVGLPIALMIRAKSKQ